MPINFIDFCANTEKTRTHVPSDGKRYSFVHHDAHTPTKHIKALEFIWPCQKQYDDQHNASLESWKFFGNTDGRTHIHTHVLFSCCAVCFTFITNSQIGKLPAAQRERSNTHIYNDKCQQQNIIVIAAYEHVNHCTPSIQVVAATYSQASETNQRNY